MRQVFRISWNHLHNQKKNLTNWKMHLNAIWWLQQSKRTTAVISLRPECGTASGTTVDVVVSPTAGVLVSACVVSAAATSETTAVDAAVSVCTASAATTKHSRKRNFVLTLDRGTNIGQRCKPSPFVSAFTSSLENTSERRCDFSVTTTRLRCRSCSACSLDSFP